MSEGRQALICCAYNFRQWRKNARVYVSFLLAFILCFLMTERTVRIARRFDTYVQVLEPFVWTFGDSTNVLLMSCLLVLLLGDIPFLTAGTPLFLVRTTRRAWLFGQVLYICGSTLLYVLFLLASVCVLCAPMAFAGDQWSEAAALMGYAGIGEDAGIPTDTTTLEMSRPAECTAGIFLLMLLYMLLLGTIMLAVSIRFGRTQAFAAAAVFSLWGLLLEPAVFSHILKLPEGLMYRANVLSVWLSPLNQATYALHSFGYNNLPRIWQSAAFFLAGSACALSFAMRSVKRCTFRFTGTES